MIPLPPRGAVPTRIIRRMPNGRSSAICCATIPPSENPRRSQLVTPNAGLWQGDVTTLLPVGRFVGTGGGILAALAVAAVAVFALRALPRAVAAIGDSARAVRDLCQQPVLCRPDGDLGAGGEGGQE